MIQCTSIHFKYIHIILSLVLHSFIYIIVLYVIDSNFNLLDKYKDIIGIYHFPPKKTFFFIYIFPKTKKKYDFAKLKLNPVDTYLNAIFFFFF